MRPGDSDTRAGGDRTRCCGWLLLLTLVLWLPSASGQQLLDRVVARAGTVAITLSDVRAASGLGVIDAPGSEASAVEALVDRQLALVEVARFPPPEPSAAEIDARVATMKAHAGAELDRLMRATGLTEQRIRDLARDTLRIQGYVDERFGTSVQVTEEDARRYYDAHPGEFTRNGALIPYEEALADAQRRASDERLRGTVEQWLKDLRARADIVTLPPIQ
jgi:hypothetical protein